MILQKAETLLEIKDLVKEYEAHRALNEVNIQIPKGSIYGLLGPNGAGKTSLIRIITQITKAESGEVFYNGEKLNAAHIAKVGYLPEERGLYKKMKVGEQLLYLARLKGLSKIDALEVIDRWLRKFEIHEWYDKNVEELSKGMQQKIQFIATVMTEPELLILDEPFSGFDPVNANLIKDEILELNRKGVTIIFSTHRMESVEELCDYIGLIHHSKVVLQGQLQEVKEQFRNGNFEVIGEGDLKKNSIFSILDSKQSELGTSYTISGESTNSGTEIIEELIKQKFTIRGFQEVYPTINDIFLKIVGED